MVQTTLYTQMSQKLANKNAKIGVIGLGYVGLPLATLIAQKGFRVTGFVRNQQKINLLKLGKSDIESVDQKDLILLQKKGYLRITHIDSDEFDQQDVFIVCVPTPVDETKKPDLTAIRSIARRLSLVILDGKLIINESTVAPGTTREEFGSLGGNYFLACSPERVDPGNKDKSVGTISKVLGGLNNDSLMVAKALYEAVLEASVVQVSSLEAAEMVKMLENTYRAVNIALVNEFARLADKTGLDVIEIIEAAKSKWSYHAHYPSVGVGGHCIPVDPWYLVELGKKKNVRLPLIEKGLHENDEITEYVADKVTLHYKKGMRVLLYGLTYKKDVKDIRESPAILLGHILQKHKIEFTVYDPLLQNQEIEALGFLPGKLVTTDMFIVCTDHKELHQDYKKTVTKQTIIIDGRNFFQNKIGKAVYGVGRSMV